MNGWRKFAILGSTYARALGNAAQRSGATLPQGTLGAIAARPDTRIAPGLATRARGGVAGAVAPTPHQQHLQQQTAKLPSTAEGGFDPAFPGRPMPGEGHATQRAMFNVHFGNKAQFAQSPSIRPYEPPAAPPPRPPVSQLLQQIRGTPPAHGAAPQSRGDATAVLHAPRPQANTATQVLKAGAAQFKIAGPLGTAAGIGIPLAIGGGLLLNKPGIKADLHERLHGQGDIHAKDMAAEIPDAVQSQASQVTQALAARGINPAGLRIAVDAPSGAGKTVLSKAIAGQLGLRHHGLDWRPNMRMHQLMGGGDIEKTPYAPHAGEILEHQQLLRSYDPELFDVAIHIHKDPEAIKQQVLHRGRGARTADLLDYDKSIGVGRKAFETLGGDVIDLGGGAMMKVRPQEGWGNMLDQQLQQIGIDPAGLSRHEKLLSLHAGQRQTGAGWTPYVRNPFSGGEMAAMAASVPLGVMAARALGRH